MKSINIFLKVTALSICLFLPTQIEASNPTHENGTIHLVIVADTFASNIESAVAKDRELMRNWIQTISRSTQLPVHEMIFDTEEALHADFIENAIRHLQVHDQDVIVFYFTGHGFREFSQGGNPFPMLAFDHDYRGLDFSKVVHQLLEKEPRFLLALSDCCNNYGDMQNETIHPPVPDEVHDDLSASLNNHKFQRNMDILFKESTGTVIATAALPGEVSWADLYRGGILTTEFLTSTFQESYYSRNPSWEAILERVAYKTIQMDTTKQNTQFFVIESLSEAKDFMGTLRSLEIAGR